MKIKTPIAHHMGSTIGRMIAEAQQVKKLERTRDTSTKQEAPMLTDAQKYKLACKQRDDFKNRLTDAQAQIASLRNAKLANFSIEEIEQDLKRRLARTKV